MWPLPKKHKQSLYLIADGQEAALITFVPEQQRHPFVINSYTLLPAAWFLHGAPWHIASCSTYLKSFIQEHGYTQPTLLCACNGETQYEKIVTLAHQPTIAHIPPQHQYRHYAWHTTKMHVPQETDNPTYLICGMPQQAVFYYRLCADKSGCTLQRATTLRASMQPTYAYYQKHLLHTLSEQTAPETMIASLCTALPTTYNKELLLSALGLFLCERTSSCN